MHLSRRGRRCNPPGALDGSTGACAFIFPASQAFWRLRATECAMCGSLPGTCTVLHLLERKLRVILVPGVSCQLCGPFDYPWKASPAQIQLPFLGRRAFSSEVAFVRPPRTLFSRGSGTSLGSCRRHRPAHRHTESRTLLGVVPVTERNGRCFSTRSFNLSTFLRYGMEGGTTNGRQRTSPHPWRTASRFPNGLTLVPASWVGRGVIVYRLQADVRQKPHRAADR